MNIKTIDLNLLVVFSAVMREGTVTRAAQRLGVTQPALSNALGRLRRALSDPLFVRRGRQLVPTPRAAALAPVVERSLGALEAALSPRKAFVPAEAAGTVRLALSEYWQFMLVPELLSMLSTEAPSLDLAISDLTPGVLNGALAVGKIDAAIFLSSDAQPDLHGERLVEDSYVAVVRRGHSLTSSRLSLEAYASCAQVRVTPVGPWAERIGRALGAAGLSSAKVLETAHVQVAVEIVSRTDHLAVLPRHIALQARSRWPVKLLPLPVDAGGLALSLYWHARSDADPLHRWFRSRLSHLARVVYHRRPTQEPRKSS